MCTGTTPRLMLYLAIRWFIRLKDKWSDEKSEESKKSGMNEALSGADTEPT